MTEKMFDWCIAELQYKANIFKKTGAVSVYRGDVVKSDSAIPSELKDELKRAVAPLENVHDRLKDWHPGSNEQVLDLVHPSLFPLVYGKSRILVDSLTTLPSFVERCGEGNVVPVPPQAEAKIWPPSDYYWSSLRLEDPFSRKFQWLPCDVDISSEGSARYDPVHVEFPISSDSSISRRITSYINNLHPHKHADLYEIIEKIIARAIPIWNLTLTPLREGPKAVRIQYDECLYDPNPEFDDKTQGPQLQPNENVDDFYQRREDWMAAIRKVVHPEPGLFYPPEEPKNSVDLFKDYGNRGLQIIVKLANIHLTPEKPNYNGGTWHVEGQLVRSPFILSFIGSKLTIS